MSLRSLAHAQPPVEKKEFGGGGPLAEGRARRRYIKWGSLGEQELIETANRIILEKGIRSMRQMKADDNSMFRAIRERGLDGKVSLFKGNGAGTNPLEPAASGAPEAGAEAPQIETPPGKEAGGREAGGRAPGAHPGLSQAEVAELAQLVIDEGKLSGMEELSIIDPEIAGALKALKAEGLIVFATDEAGPAGGQEPGGVKKQAPAEISEEEMFRRICEECFRVSGGNPFLGTRRGTIPKLQSSIKRKLTGPQHRVFKKCWDRMEAEGAIVYNTNKSAASLDLYCEPRTEGLKEALRWASGQCASPGQNAQV